MTVPDVLRALEGRHLQAAFALKYAEDSAPGVPSAEAVEFVFGPGDSVVLSCESDWTLAAASNHWPDLPDWCWPPESWGREQIDLIGTFRCDRIIATASTVGPVEELMGVVFEFEAARMTIRSGESISWEISTETNDQ